MLARLREIRFARDPLRRCKQCTISREITCITWNKDYQGLFDYESKEITRFPLTTKQSGILMKVGNQFEVVTQLTKAMVTEVLGRRIQNSDKFLFKFVKKPDCFHIEPLAIETNNFVY